MDGREVPLAVESGVIRMRVQLLYSEPGGGAPRALANEMVREGVRFSNGVVDIQGLSLSGLPDLDKTKGRYILRLGVEPVGGPPSLTGFQADIDLGDWNGLRAGQQLGADTGPKVQPAVKITAVDGSGFALGMIDGRTYGPVDENTILRRIQLSLHVPIQGSSFNESLEGEIFTISSVEPGRPLLYTAVVKQGLLTWQDSVVHNYYQVMNEPLKRAVVFTRVKTGKTIAKEIDLTPWVRYMIVIVDGAQHNQDVTPAAPPVKGAIDRRPQIRLEAPCMSQGDIRYAVDPASLSLRVNIQPFLQFTPRVRRYDEPFFGMNTFDAQGLRPGYYQLTLAVFNLDRENWTDPVSITQKVVTVLGGNLSLQLKLQSRELSMLRLRNYVVAQIDFLDPNSLTPTADGGVTGRVMDDRELGISKPAGIFPLVFSNGSCTSSPAAENLSNPHLRALADQIRDKKIDLLALASQSRMDDPTAAKTGAGDPANWRAAAQEWGLEPIELGKPGDEAKLGYDSATDLDKVKEALECAYQIGEQDAKMPAKCQYGNFAPLGDLCRAIALKWTDMLVSAVEAGPHNGWERPGMLSVIFFRACYAGDVKTHLVVRKYIQVGDLERADDVQVLRGSPAFDVGLKDQFFLGTDHGTEFMHENRNKLTESLRLPSVVAEKIFAASPDGALNGALRVAGKVSGGAFTKTQESFRWLFNYQIPYQAAGLSSSTSLTMENLDIRLTLKRHRVCYSIEPSIDPALWEGLLVPFTYEQGPRALLYVCLPESQVKTDISERYFFVYNNAASGGAMVDSDRSANRWFLTFRGERDFGVFMRSLRPHIKNLYRGENKVMETVGTIVESARTSSLMDNISFPGVVAAPRPSPENYDSIYNLEGFMPKVVRWISETLNPFEDYGQPTAVDQNSPDTRVYRGRTER